MIGVAIIDDHPAVLAGLTQMLATQDDMRVVGTATTLASGGDLVADDAVDVALIDIKLADGSGLELVAHATKGGRPSAIVLSSFAHTPYVVAAVAAGARGYLLKTAPLLEVAEAIRRVAAGGTVFTADQLRETQRPSVVLSERDRQVVRLLVASRSNDEIAQALGLSRKTIEATLTRLYERYSALSRTELAIRAIEEAWLDT